MKIETRFRYACGHTGKIIHEDSGSPVLQAEVEALRRKHEAARCYNCEHMGVMAKEVDAQAR